MIWCSIRKSGEPWKECRRHCKKLAKQYYFYRTMMLDESPVFMSIEHPMGGKYEVVFMPRGTSLNQSQYYEVYRDIYGDMTYGKRIEVELRIPDCIIPELDPHIQVVPLLNFEPEPEPEAKEDAGKGAKKGGKPEPKKAAPAVEKHAHPEVAELRVEGWTLDVGTITALTMTFGIHTKLCKREEAFRSSNEEISWIQ